MRVVSLSVFLLSAPLVVALSRFGFLQSWGRQEIQGDEFLEVSSNTTSNGNAKLNQFPPGGAPPAAVPVLGFARPLDPTLLGSTMGSSTGVGPDGFPLAKIPLRERPYVSKEQCKELEEAMLVEPRPTCERGEVDLDTDACYCKMKLPPNVQAVPETTESAVAAEENPDAVQFEPPAAPEPVINTGAPYQAPSMAAECPFAQKCEEPTCVGYNSFGFSEVMMSRYSPASRLLNTIHCSYLMHITGNWTEPPRVAMLKAKLKEME